MLHLHNITQLLTKHIQSRFEELIFNLNKVDKKNVQKKAIISWVKQKIGT